MVDADVVIPGLTDRGKLLTLTTEEALKTGIADFAAPTLALALEKLGLKGAQVVETSVNWAEEFVRFLTNPIVSSLLVTIATLGIILEIRTPGFGIPGALGITSLGLFLYGHTIVKLAGVEELLMVGLGIVLLLVEAFVLPGFGIAGILGLMALLGGLMMSTLGEGFTMDSLYLAAAQVGASLAVAIVISLLMLRFLPKTKFGRQLVLDTGLTAKQGFTSEPLSDHELVGQTGVTQSVLRPAGIAEIGGKRIDVVSDGGYIEAGQSIKVDHVDGNRIVVIEIAHGQTQVGDRQ